LDLRSYLHLLPKPIQDLINAIPTQAFDAIDWLGAISVAPKLAQGFFDRVLVEQAMAEVSLPAGVRFDRFTAATISDRDAFATSVVSAYLHLFTLVDKPLFVDFRTAAFSQDERGLIWQPVPIFGTIPGGILQGLRKLYEGHARGDHALLAQGVAEAGFWPKGGEPPADLVAAVQKTMDGSPANTGNMFVALKKYQVKLPKEFIYLGIMLTTFNETMKQLGVETLPLIKKFFGVTSP
jgi:hypothetical protein